MKTSRAFRTMLIVIVLLACASITFSQTWQPLQHQPTFNASTSLLLTDGAVMVHQEGARQWWKLTPDINGSYVNGIWTPQAGQPLLLPAAGRISAMDKA